MRSLYFPRAIVPLATTLGNFYMTLPGVLVIVIVAVATGEPPSWRWLALPFVLAIMLTFVAGCSMFTARLGHIFPDLDQILPHGTRLLFYASGILYDPAAFTENDTVLAMFDLNPVYQLISLIRWVVMAEATPPWFWLSSTAYALFALATGFVYFWRAELTYGSPR
jgi:teichoic acid transport system permease protein